VLESLEDLELGEEVWMHVAPTKEELLRHGLRLGKELETNRSDGMVEVTGQEGRRRGDHRGSNRDIWSEADVFVEKKEPVELEGGNRSNRYGCCP
jgi:hypothetical protein